MADRRKNKVKDKSPTIMTKELKKKKGREKKPTLSLSDGIVAPKNENEKEQAKPINVKGIKPKGKPLTRSLCSQVPPQATEKPAPAVEKDELKREEPQVHKTSLNRRVTVLFVCTGNTCRSAMAQYIFADFLKGKGEEGNVDVSGAGLSAFNGDDMSEQAKETLIERGIFGVNHFARRLTRDMAESADLVVCMTESHARAIGVAPNVTTIARITGGADVSDPWGGTLDDYRKVAAYLRYACDDIYDALVKISNRA